MEGMSAQGSHQRPAPALLLWVFIYLLGNASNSCCSSALRHRQGHQCHHRHHLPARGSDRPWVGWGEKVPFLALKRVNKEKKAKRKKSEGFITQLAP